MKPNLSVFNFSSLQKTSQPTLGFALTTNIRNGACVGSISVDVLSKVPNNLEGVEKRDLPVIYPYNGVKGTYSPSNIVFVDIDTTTGVQIVMENSDKLFSKLRNIVFMQKSASGKLHIVIQLPGLVIEEPQYKKWSVLYTIAVLQLIKLICNVDYFEIPNAIDTHNTKFTQALYISKYPIVINPDYAAESVILNKESISSIISIANKYSISFGDDTSEERSDSYKTEMGDWDSMRGSDKVLDINKNFSIEGYTYKKQKDGTLVRKPCSFSGNDLRWRIASAVYNMFANEDDDTEAREFIKEHFVQSSEIIASLRTAKNKKPNQSVKNWLIDTFSITRAQAEYGHIGLCNGQYLSDIESDIINLIDKSNVNCEIIAPTGTGKTTLINSREGECDLFSENLSKEGLAFVYNAVVVVPFNVTNALYYNLESVNSSNSKEVNMKIINSGKPFVCVFDQFVKHYKLLEGRTIIVDEAHLLFTTRDWREKSAEMLQILRDVQHKILFTATPEGEAELLGIKRFNISKKEKLVRSHVIRFESQKAKAIWEENNIIDYKSDDFDNICFFDDTNNLKIADLLRSKMLDYTLFRSDTKNDVKVEELIDTEIIKDKYLVATNIAQQGLNFNNEGRICIVCSFIEGSDFVSDIAQSVGRFRKAKSIDLYVLFTNVKHEDVDTKKDRVEKVNKVYTDNDIEEFNTTDQFTIVNYDVIKELEEYRKVHSTFKILEDWLSTGRFYNVCEKQRTGFERRYLLQEKREQDSLFIENLKSGCVDCKSDNRYYGECEKLLGKLRRFLDTDVILEMYSKKSKNCLFSSFASELLECYRFVEMDKDVLDKGHKTVVALLKKEKDYDVKNALKRTQKCINTASKIRKQVVSVTDDVFAKLFLDDLESEMQASSEKKTDAGRTGGKFGSPKKRVVDDKGIEYESNEACAKANGISPSTSSKRIKKGLYHYV